MRTRKNLVVGLAAVLLLAAVPGLAAADVIYEVDLQPTDAAPDACGYVAFGFTEVGRPPHVHLDVVFGVEVWDVWDVCAALTVEVWINDDYVDSFDLVNGHGGFWLDSDNGDAIPTWDAGAILHVLDPLTGTVLLTADL
jgi:hypothetical protein